MNLSKVGKCTWEFTFGHEGTPDFEVLIGFGQLELKPNTVTKISR